MLWSFTCWGLYSCVKTEISPVWLEHLLHNGAITKPWQSGLFESSLNCCQEGVWSCNTKTLNVPAGEAPVWCWYDELLKPLKDLRSRYDEWQVCQVTWSAISSWKHRRWAFNNRTEELYWSHHITTHEHPRGRIGGPEKLQTFRSISISNWITLKVQTLTWLKSSVHLSLPSIPTWKQISNQSWPPTMMEWKMCLSTHFLHHDQAWLIAYNHVLSKKDIIC